MVNIDKIKQLSREQGIKMGFLAQQIGVQHTYFANVKNMNRDIPDSRLSVIADTLNTTVAYLRDETDVKEKPSANSEELNLDKNTIVVRGRDGSVETKTLTDKQFHALQVIIDQFADAPDDL